MIFLMTNTAIYSGDFTTKRDSGFSPMPLTLAKIFFSDSQLTILYSQFSIKFDK